MSATVLLLVDSDDDMMLWWGRTENGCVNPEITSAQAFGSGLKLLALLVQAFLVRPAPPAEDVAPPWRTVERPKTRAQYEIVLLLK